jgi:hypothetical protein
MANKTFIGEEIFEFKPMRGLETKYNTPSPGDFPIDPSPAGGGPKGDFPIDPSPGDFPTPIDPPPTGGGPKGGPEQPEEPPEQPEDDETPQKSNTLTFLAIGLIAFFLLRKK